MIIAAQKGLPYFSLVFWIVFDSLLKNVSSGIDALFCTLEC